MQRGDIRTKRRALLIAITVVLAFLPMQFAMATAVTSASDTLSTIKQSVGANHTIQFTLGGSDQFVATNTITLTFPTGFDLTALSSPNDFDFQDAATAETLQSAACGATNTVQVGVSGQVVTFTACGTFAAEAAGSTIIIKIGTNAVVGATGTHQIVNQTAAQNASDQKIVIGGTQASGSIAVDIIANNQVTVTATVDPSITCAVDNTSTTFSTFTIGSVTTAGSTITWTVGTNATGGYALNVSDAGNATNPGLYSSTAGYLIGSADTSYASTSDLSIAATIGYGAQASKTNGDAGSAATTVAAPYTSSGTTVGKLQLTSQLVASSSGAVSNATVTTTLKAKVTGLVPAGSYTDTLTYTCTGTY